MTENDSAPKRKSRKGCIITFLIGLAFLLILAALAIPDFLKMTPKPKAGEAKCNLQAFYTSQKKYHEKYGRYAGHDGDKKCFELLDWSPEGQNLYTYYCDTDVFPAKKGDHRSCPVPDVPPVTENSFTIFAVANIDRDPACDVWSINDANKRIVHVDDIKD